MSSSLVDSASRVCSDVLPYYNSSGQHYVMFVHVIASMCGIFCTGLFLKFGKHSLYFHRNCTLLIYLICLCHVMECLSIGGTQAFHLLLLKFKTYPCDLLVPNWFCFTARTPSLFFNTYMIFLFCAVLFERFLAIYWCKEYEKKNMAIGLILAAIALFPSMITSSYSLRKFPMTGRTWYCASAIHETIDDISIMANFLAFFTLIPTVSLFILWYYNDWKKNRQPYNVTTRYQLAENLSVLRLLTPQVVLFTVFQCSFSLINSFSYIYVDMFSTKQQLKTFLAAINIAVYHPILSTLLFLFILLRNKHRRKCRISKMQTTAEEQRQAYFNAYQKQWN